ncbi:MAG: SulP family inorganic anion transporter [Gammaproteobacteria bacterium]
MLAILEAYRAGLLKKENWWPNIIAGLTVGVVAIPLAMAFAIASGVKPEQGLYTAIIAAVIVGLFGGSRAQIAGPTGAFIVILANITAHHGIAGLQMASLMAGFILLFMGLVKLGNVIKFIPDPVIVGFTTGIGIIIFVGEWKDFLGLNVHLPVDSHFYQKLFELIKALPHLDLSTTSLGFLSLLLMLIVPKFLKKIPGALIALLIVTIIQSFFHFKNVATIGSTFGGISKHLPHLQLPSITFNESLDLIGAAFTIALLGAIESLLSATAADGMANTHHHSNQELIGQGIANIFAPLFGGFAATGAIARTATNIRNGGNSPIAAIIHSLVLLFVLTLLAPFASNIPLCTLAAILFIVAYNMSDLPHFIRIIKKAPHYDMIVLLVTFLLTVFTNLVVAVNVGVILAILFFVRRMHQSVIIEQQNSETLQAELSKVDTILTLPKELLVYTIQGPFFFGVAEKVEHALAMIATEPKIIIFRLKGVPFIDMTGLETFNELIEHYRKRDVQVYICEANANVERKLANMGILDLVSNNKIFNNITEIMNLLTLQDINTKSKCDNLTVCAETQT